MKSPRHLNEVTSAPSPRPNSTVSANRFDFRAVLKPMIVRLAADELIPAALATWIINRAGLRHV